MKMINKFINKLDKNWQVFLIFVLFFVSINTILRFFLAYKEYDLIANIFILTKLLILGFFKDLSAIFILGFIAIFKLQTASKIFSAKFIKWSTLFSFFIFSIIITFSAIAEWFFWDEFRLRFNFMSVEYLNYSTEIINNIIESYPMSLIFIILFCTGAFFTAICYPLFKAVEKNKQREHKKHLIHSFYISIVALFCALFNINISNNLVATELHKNGSFEFFKALITKEIDFDKHFENISFDQALNIVGKRAKLLNEEFFIKNNILFKNIKSPFKESNLNLIFVIMESMGTKYLSFELTPFLNTIKDESLYFSNIFASGTRTVRGLEAISLATPPLPGRAMLRRLKKDRVYSAGEILKQNNYQNFFITGGDSYFDNIDDFYTNNGFTVIDQKSFLKTEITFKNAWGASDQDIFSKAISVMDTQYDKNKKSAIFVLTGSNHQPFTYPNYLGNNKKEMKTRTGAIKYADYAIKEFLTNAKDKKWFKDTVFVLVADHSTIGRKTYPLALEDYQIPFFIYSPFNIMPQKIETVGAQIDVLPTLLSIMGINFKAPFVGENLLFTPSNQGRAFVATFDQLGYFDANKKLLVMIDNNKKSSAFTYDIDSKKQERVFDISQEQKEITQAFYQYSFSLLKNPAYRIRD